MKLNEDRKTVAAMDCLVPGIGEIIGGSQREDDYDLLVKRMEELEHESGRLCSSIWICANMVPPIMQDSVWDLNVSIMYADRYGQHP